METTHDTGLIAAYLLDGEGGGRHIDWTEVRTWSADQGVLWLHMDYSHPEVQQWLQERSGLDEVSCDMLLAEETRPRTVPEKEGLLVMLRGVNLNPGANPEDMVSIRMWIDASRVITTGRRRLLSVDDLSVAIERRRGPATPGEFLVDMADSLVMRMQDVLEEIDQQVDGLEGEELSSVGPSLRNQLAAVRRQVIGLRRYLSPQREAMGRLLHEKLSWLDEVDRVRLREITDRVIRFVEDLDELRDRASLIQEEIANRLSDQLNQRMYVLSVVAAVFLPLGFITGLLGINVGGIPGADNPLAFAVVILLCLLLVGFEVWLFRRRAWL